ncbi:type II toxin-antitoxin system Phd/YefM family antitoxin [Flammeovirga pectinis]|uniref:hypothetical protein n=1 Tax=Flammeovirga pectinis TaxID=2494373 RepID=UPI0012D77C64|nr:hypothetical protein [Flammeovirga pectinis]
MAKSKNNSLEEIKYLLSTKANRDNLNASLEEIEKGKSTTSANINALFNDLGI